jgi:hypothetical protein
VQELITNAFSNTGQPEFELIKLQTKAAKENNNYEILFCFVMPTIKIDVCDFVVAQILSTLCQ